MSDSTAPQLISELRGNVLWLTLNRPEIHNAFGDELIADLTQALVDAETDDSVHAIVLTGAGPTFSAGADMNWMRSMAQASEEENREDALRLAKLLRTLNFHSKPTIARVNGAAFGGGVTDQVFGARTTNVLQRGTVYLGSLFFLLSLALAVLIGHQNKQVTVVEESATDAVEESAVEEPAAGAVGLCRADGRREEPAGASGRRRPRRARQ